jgi:hypothetical protein
VKSKQEQPAMGQPPLSARNHAIELRKSTFHRMLVTLLVISVVLRKVARQMKSSQINIP